MSLRDVVIVDVLRTAFGSWQGTLTNLEADQLAAPLLLELVKRNNIDPGSVDLCIMGNVDNHSNAPNLGRLALLRAKFPHHVPGYTVEHQCAPSTSDRPSSRPRVSCFSTTASSSTSATNPCTAKQAATMRPR